MTTVMNDYGFVFKVPTSLLASPRRIVIESPTTCSCGRSLVGERLYDVAGVAVCEDCVASTPGSAEYERQTIAAL